MLGLLSVIPLFGNKFNKFNNTGAGMLDSIYHMILKLLKNLIFGVKTSRFCHLSRNIIINIIVLLNCEPQVVYLFCCMALYHSQMRSHVINSSFALRLKIFKL